MKRARRVLLAVVVTTASLGAVAGSASAAISPNPYTFSVADAGTKVERTVLGTSTCAVTGITGTLTGNVNGASGTITGATLGRCSGIMTAGIVLGPLSIDINRGAVTLRIANLISNILGGRCLYAGTLTGTVANGASTIVARTAALALVTRLSGTCDASLDLTVSISSRASITW